MTSWLFPTDYDPAETEFHHLLSEADKDMDSRLTEEEIIENYHLLLEGIILQLGVILHLFKVKSQDGVK